MDNQEMINEDLCTAAQKHDIARAKVYISMGADVNYATFQGLTPLMFAINGNDMEMIKFLLKNGADPHKEIRPFTGGCITAITFARYIAKNDFIADFLEYY